MGNLLMISDARMFQYLADDSNVLSFDPRTLREAQAHGYKEEDGPPHKKSQDILSEAWGTQKDVFDDTVENKQRPAASSAVEGPYVAGKGSGVAPMSFVTAVTGGRADEPKMGKYYSMA